MAGNSEADAGVGPTGSPRPDRPAPQPPDIENPDAGARGGLYAMLARAFRPPDEALHHAFASGAFAEELAALIDRTRLDVTVPSFETDDDPDLLSARYNDLFVIGYSEYVDRTDGTLDATEPPVPLHESAYRTDVSWNDINLDLARAYDYFGVEIPGDRREHHDHIRLLLEFAGYLARQEALGAEETALARLDFLDRHLRIAIEGIVDRVADEPGTNAYGALATACDRVSAADRAALAARLEGES